MQGVAATGAAAAFAPAMAFAAEGKYEAMVLGCIDPRMPEPMHRYTTRQHLTGKFSQFIIAGAAIGVVAEPFKDWQKAFWDNLATSIQLHHIKKVIAIDHRDCGAAKIAYGAAKVANPKIETETHRDRDGRIPQAGEGPPSRAEGRDRADGDQRQDRDVRLGGAHAPRHSSTPPRTI